MIRRQHRDPSLLSFIVLFALSLCDYSCSGKGMVQMNKHRISQVAACTLITFAPFHPLLYSASALTTNEVATKLASTQGANVQSSRKIGLVKGTLRGCSADENCFSTSARSAGKQISPWTYQGSFDADKPDLVWSRIVQACKENGLTVLQNKHEEGSTDDYYLLAAEKDVDKQPAGSSLFYEFVIRPVDKIVLQRAFVDKTVFVYPIQQPVSDFGALQGRLSSVQKAVNMKDIEL
jgi:hypothetical protein